MKIKRDAFLYMDPRPPFDHFGQCETCVQFTGDVKKTCLIHGKSLKVIGEDSCGLYSHGEPQPEEAGEEIESVFPSESGFVSRQTRCENCKHFDQVNVCLLYRKLNTKCPDLFELDEVVERKGCCNAQIPLESVK